MNDQEKAQEKGRRLEAAQDAIRAEIKRQMVAKNWTVDDLARAVAPAPDRLAAYLDVAPAELEERHIETVERALVAEGLSLTARRRRLSALNRFVGYMRDGCEQPSLGPRLLRASRRSSPLDHLLIGLIYLAGLRLQEIAHLEGRDIRVRKELLTTRLGYRIVPVHPVLREIVRSMRHHVPLVAFRPVMPGINGFAVNARTLHGRFQRLVERAGLRGVKPDALRREVSMFLISDGTPRGLVKSFLGKDRGQPLAPRKGKLADLTCLRQRLEKLPT